jgi:hypothetical protein
MSPKSVPRFWENDMHPMNSAQMPRRAVQIRPCVALNEWLR